MTTATVIKHWKDRDYCFVATDDGREAHMHASACRADFDKLVQGAQLECELVDKGDGRWSAKKAALVYLPDADADVERIAGLIQRSARDPKHGVVVSRRRVSSGWHLSPVDARAALVRIAGAGNCNAILSMACQKRRAHQGGNYYRTEHCYTADVCIVLKREPADLAGWLERNEGMLTAQRADAVYAEAVYGGGSLIGYHLKGAWRFASCLVSGQPPSRESVLSAITVATGGICVLILLRFVGLIGA